MIYFLQSGPDDYIKIGWTKDKDPAKSERLANHQGRLPGEPE